MSRTRVVVLAGVALVIAACGGGGTSLEDWAEEADAICEDLADALEDADADEIDDEIEDAIDALDELDAPGGDDADVVEDAISALEDGLEAQAAAVSGVGEGDDAFAEIVRAAAGADVEEELDLVDESGADECVDALEAGVGDRNEFEVAVDVAGDIVALRVGDCVVLDPDFGEADCEAAQAEIVKTSLGEPDCPDDADVTQTFERSSDRGSVTLGLCMISLASPDDTDGFLEEGSCADIEALPDGDFNVVEVGCDAPEATHEITFGTNDAGDCFDDEIAFATSDDEQAEFGFETWCAEPIE